MNKAEHELMHELCIKHHHYLNKEEVIRFFDKQAPSWDANQEINDDIIAKILNAADIKSGVSVLDVACGTGVMFDYYLERGVSDITGLDISPEMIRLCKEKFPVIDALVGDAEEINLGRTFDRIMIYNAFPHFSNPAGLISNLSAHLKPGGRLTIAHGMSREALDRHHSKGAMKVSVGLMSENDLKKIMDAFLITDIKISDNEKYIVSAYKK